MGKWSTKEMTKKLQVRRLMMMLKAYPVSCSKLLIELIISLVTESLNLVAYSFNFHVGLYLLAYSFISGTSVDFDDIKECSDQL